MNTIVKYTIAIFLSLSLVGQAQGQDNRTNQTKRADILAQFPTKDLTHLDKLMAEIIELGSDAMAQFCDLIVPPGTGDDTQTRYALESLARYTGAPGREKEAVIVEKVLLKALNSAKNKEVQAFFIRRLIYCGGDESVLELEKYLLDDKLYSPVLSVLSTIDTDQAGEVVLKNLGAANAKQQIRFVKVLGELKYKEAEKDLIAIAENASGELQRQTLYALAKIGQATSEATLVKAAKEAKYLANAEGAMIAYIQYAQELAGNGYIDISNKISLVLLKKCKAENQLHFRSAGLSVLRTNMGSESMPILLKEIKNDNAAYRNAVLTYAKDGISPEELSLWIEESQKSDPDTKAQIIYSFAKCSESKVLKELILPGLKDNSLAVRVEAIQALALNQQNSAVPILLNTLIEAQTDTEKLAIKKALIETCNIDDNKLLVKYFGKAKNGSKAIIIEILGAKRAVKYFDLILEQCSLESEILRSAAYPSLKNVSQTENLKQLLNLLLMTSEEKYITDVQDAIISVVDENDDESAGLILSLLKDSGEKEKLIPVLPYLNNDKALNSVVSLIEKGNESEREVALEAIYNWKKATAIPHLFAIISNEKHATFHSKGFVSYLELVNNSNFPDDQKLLLIRKLWKEAGNEKEKTMILRSSEGIKTFLSLVFVSQFIDEEDIGPNAASACMKIMIPTPGKNDGLSGDFVKDVALKVMEKLSGSESQYSRIDIQEFLDKMSSEVGYVSIFNGKNLDGWHGLVKNPIERSKMSAEELAKEQVLANEKMKENWSVRDGSIWFSGKGDNLCSKIKYGDFDMLVDWKITKHGDSGLYLRGSPQVQIWDTSRVDVGAQVGSGGLYNNLENESKPLVLADNAIGDWNTFRIKMVGDKVSVYLNGQLVVDNVTMENYWDRSTPIFPKEAIELQAHGTDLAFRNIYIREINSGSNQLPEEEIEDGFVSLFNGKDLDYWIGNKTDYLVEDKAIAVRPIQGGHGNLLTSKEYSDFIFRFEFQLTPGANNGLGIHAPVDGDIAYVGKELQILDNTASIYANLEPYQYHGSVYGIIPAKRGFLNPVGEWNAQEVWIKGDDVRVILNGTVILEGNMKNASKKGTLDKRDHPGLKRHKGHIGFLGHGSELKLRNLRIKEL